MYPLAAEIKDRERELRAFQVRVANRGNRGARCVRASVRALFSISRSCSTSSTPRVRKDNRISIVPLAPNRGLILDRNGVVLARNYSAYTLEIAPSRVRDLERTIDRAGRDRRHPAARPGALSQAARRKRKRGQRADPHAVDRRRSRALRGEPLTDSPGRDPRAAVSGSTRSAIPRRM
jgi:hypothetical protein